MACDNWVEKKLSSGRPSSQDGRLDRSKRKYLMKREKRLYGSDSAGDRKGEGGFVELNLRVVEFDWLHEREEELYFSDAFAYPWDKDKHYKMVYKLEKEQRKQGGGMVTMEEWTGQFVFFDKDVVKEKGGKKSEDEEKDLVVEKVEEFFKCVKKVPRDGDEGEGGDGEPYLVTRSTELPLRWDGPNVTVLLI